jgi:hypothetical protein
MGEQKPDDSLTFQWSALPPMQFPRSEPVALLLEDGRLFVVGRVGWIWDPQTGWQKREDLPPEVLAADLSQWKVAADLVDSEGQLKGVRGVLWDDQAGEWVTVARLPQRPCTESLTLASGSQLTVGGKQYLPGDSSPTALDTCVIRTKAGHVQTLRLKQARMSPALTPLPDGRVLATGGVQVDSYFPDHDKTVPAKEAEIIEPEANAIRAGGRLVKPRYGHGVAVSKDGSVFLVGGADDLESALAEVEVGRPVPSNG